VKLADLEAEFVRSVPKGIKRVETFAEAQGVLFLCPACYGKNGGAVGTHSILVWFDGRSVPPEERPAPRWQASGTSIADLTLAPSVDVTAGGKYPGEWHGFVRNGEIT